MVAVAVAVAGGGGGSCAGDGIDNCYSCHGNGSLHVRYLLPLLLLFRTST